MRIIGYVLCTRVVDEAKGGILVEGRRQADEQELRRPHGWKRTCGKTGLTYERRNATGKCQPFVSFQRGHPTTPLSRSELKMSGPFPGEAFLFVSGAVRQDRESAVTLNGGPVESPDN